MKAMKATVVPIKYVGKKTQQTDSVAGTGLVWLPGEVHVVPSLIAAKLLRHPDVWADATEEVKNDPSSIGMVINSLPETPEESVEKPQQTVDMPNLQGMTKADIVAYGQREFHQDLDANATKEDLISRVISLRNARDTMGEDA